MHKQLRHLRFLLPAIALFGAASVLAAPASGTHRQPGNYHRFHREWLPFHTVFSGPIAPRFAPGYPSVRSMFGKRCSVPSDWITVWSATAGYGTHLGRFTVARGTDCGRLDSATGDLNYSEGRFTIRATKRRACRPGFHRPWSTAHVTYTNGHGNIRTGTFADEWRAHGGTGRFVGMKGHGTDNFQVDVTAVPRTFVGTGDGWISYGSPERRRHANRCRPSRTQQASETAAR